MPHDIKGRKIDAGDVVIANHWTHGMKPSPHVVHGVSESQDSCNVHAVPVHHPLTPPQSYNAKEVEIACKADGSSPV